MAKVIGVSVGSDGTVCCLDSVGDMYTRAGNAWVRNTKGLAAEIAVGNRGDVWARNKDGHVFKHLGTGYNHDWEKDGSASQVTSISAGADGTLWVANEKGNAVKLEGATWKQNPHAKDVVEVSVGNAENVWYRDDSGNIHQLDTSGRSDGKWDSGSGASKVASISVGGDGTVWVANTDNELWTLSGGEWKKNDKGEASQVSVGRNGLVWCVNNDGQVFHNKSVGYDTHWVSVDLPDMPTTAVIEQGDTLLEILRQKYPDLKNNPAKLTAQADKVAKLNGWGGKLADNYDGHATSLDAGDEIILEFA